ncbi:MAG: non-canonical purine NTP pyrophosphatase [Candidatus Nealsonbacteria bacterium]
MKKIYFVTSNKAKHFSAKTYLKRFGIDVIQKNLEIPESRGSVEEIAVKKAKYAYKIFRKPLIAMDSGFFIHSLKGFPMMFTNFVLKTIGIEGILKLVKGTDSICEFKEVLSYCDSPRKKPKLFTRIIKGRISEKPLGKVRPYHWSDLALVFIPVGEEKTLAEMTKKEFMDFRKTVNKNSHWVRFGKFFSKIS